jgi:hypothetical protein
MILKYVQDSTLEIAAAFRISELAAMLPIDYGWLIPEKLADELLLKLKEELLTMHCDEYFFHAWFHCNKFKLST